MKLETAIQEGSYCDQNTSVVETLLSERNGIFFFFEMLTFLNVGVLRVLTMSYFRLVSITSQEPSTCIFMF